MNPSFPRIAFSLDNMEIGGTELNALRIARRLAAEGTQLSVILLGPDGPLNRHFEAAGIPIHRFRTGALYSPGAWRQGMRLVRFLRHERFDLLHAHDMYSNLFSVPWARAAGVAAVASRRWWEGSSHPVRRTAHRMAYRFAHAVLANTDAVAELLRNQEGVPAERIGVVRNHLDAWTFDPPPDDVRQVFRQELGIPPSAPCVGVVSSIYPLKGHASLIRALPGLLSAHPELRLVLVGRDAGGLADVQRLASALGVEHAVVVAGHRSNRPNLHFHFDVSVLPSLSEGLPNSVLEAMAAARPVVATRVGGVPDAIVAGTSGLIVPPDDTSALEAAIRRLLDHPEDARRLGLAAAERARTLYAPERTMQDLHALYDLALRRAGRTPRASPGALAGTH